MDAIKVIHYWGRPCRHGHHNEQGLSLRYVKSSHCVECEKGYRITTRGQEYKDYQATYHKELREKKPEVLKKYRATQVSRGHFGYYKTKNKNASSLPAMNNSYVNEDTQDKGAI